MQDLNSPRSYTHTSTSAAQGYTWHQKWKSTSSFCRFLIGFITLITLSYAALLSSSATPRIRSGFFDIPQGDDHEAKSNQLYERKVMETLFERAAMPNKTVIITTLNAAWAEEGTMIDMFLESFCHGDGTRKLLEHLVIVCVDNKAYQRCLVLHPHCLYIKTDEVDFAGEQLLLSAGFINLMWRRIEFLGTVLAMNYSFIFTDTDVLWFRNPFPLLQSDTEADFQIACDRYIGKPRDVRNKPNTGFLYVRPNARTVKFFHYWYEQRKRDPHMADQDMLNVIKFDEEFKSIGMKLRFLDTQFLGGFCGLKSTNMAKAITMHATCCRGLEAKLTDLRMMLDGWKEWHAQNLALSSIVAHSRDKVEASPHNASANPLGLLPAYFKVPLACQRSWRRH